MANLNDLPVATRRAEPTETETRFQALVQSPLRAAILRFLCARPEEAFDVESLMSTFGRMRLDVENCVRELADFGVARMLPGQPPHYIADRPENEAVSAPLDHFL